MLGSNFVFKRKQRNEIPMFQTIASIAFKIFFQDAVTNEDKNNLS